MWLEVPLGRFKSFLFNEDENDHVMQHLIAISCYYRALQSMVRWHDNTWCSQTKQNLAFNHHLSNTIAFSTLPEKHGIPCFWPQTRGSNITKGYRSCGNSVERTNTCISNKQVCSEPHGEIMVSNRFARRHLFSKISSLLYLGNYPHVTYHLITQLCIKLYSWFFIEKALCDEIVGDEGFAAI